MKKLAILAVLFALSACTGTIGGQKVCTNDYLLGDRKSTRLNSSHMPKSRMPSSA